MVNYSQDIISFIEKLIEKLRWEWSVVSIDNAAPLNPLISFIENTSYYIEENEKIDLGFWEFISGTGYVFQTVLSSEVVSIDNNIIEVENTELVDLSNVTTIRNLKPYFYHGTYIDVNKEIDTSKEIFSDAIYPAVIVWEVIRQSFEAEHTSVVGNSPKLTMSFLDTTNKLDWTNDDQYQKVIYPMENFADKFIHICDNHPFIAKLQDYTYIKHSNWGKIVQDKGHIKYLLDENLAGLNLEIELPIKKACLNKFAKL